MNSENKIMAGAGVILGAAFAIVMALAVLQTSGCGKSEVSVEDTCDAEDSDAVDTAEDVTEVDAAAEATPTQ